MPNVGPERVVRLGVVDDRRIVHAEAASNRRAFQVVSEAGARREILVGIGEGRRS